MTEPTENMPIPTRRGRPFGIREDIWEKLNSGMVTKQDIDDINEEMLLLNDQAGELNDQLGTINDELIKLTDDQRVITDRMEETLGEQGTVILELGEINQGLTGLSNELVARTGPDSDLWVGMTTAQIKANSAVTGNVMEFAISDSDTVAPTSGWSTVSPERTPGAYIWARTHITYGSGDTTITSPVVLTGNDGAPGKDGEDGRDGIPGKDGVGLVDTVVEYALSTTGDVAPPSGWSTTAPALIKGRWLWTRTTWHYSDESTETGHSVSYLAVDGSDGEDGLPGKDGTSITDTVVTYAKSSSGTTPPTAGWSDQPPSTNPGDFVWTRYVWHYSDGTSETGYSIGKIGDTGAKGDPGPQGVPGAKGADGVTTYTWIRYADSATGAGISNSPAGKTHIGFAYNKTTPTESNTPTDYTWSLIKGDKGDTGVPGAPGTDGQTTYTWIKYADNADGTGLYDVPTATTKYIGIATNKLTATESANKSDYVWSLFRGADGLKGSDGRTPFFHVAYANSADGTVDFSTTNPSGRKYMGTYTAFATLDVYLNAYSDSYGTATPSAPTDPSRYKWTLIQGVSVTDVVPHFFLRSRTLPAPGKPTVKNPVGWSTTEPLYQSGTAMYRSERVDYSNGNFSWTDVTLVSTFEVSASLITDMGVVNGKLQTLTENYGTVVGEQQQLWEGLDNAATQDDYNQLNTRLWGDQGELNRLNNALWDEQTGWNAQQIALNELYDDRFKEQGDLNQIIAQFTDDQTGWNAKMEEFATLQRDFNADSLEFERIQLEWNNEQTGWNATQAEINAINDGLWDDQIGINYLLNTRIDQNDKSIIELRKLIESSKGEQWTPVTLGPSGFVDDFNTTTSPDRVTLTVAGTWTGRIVATIVYETGPIGEKRDVQAAFTWDVGVNRSFTANHVTDWTPKFISLQYRKDAAQVHQSNTTLRNHATNESAWTVLHSLTIPKSAECIASMRVGWHATTNGNEYGIRIRVGGTSTSGGTVVASVGPRTGVGPLTPLGSGYRIMNASNESFQATAGQVVRLESYTNAITGTRREIRDATLRIAWIDKT